MALTLVEKNGSGPVMSSCPYYLVLKKETGKMHAHGIITNPFAFNFDVWHIINISIDTPESQLGSLVELVF